MKTRSMASLTLAAALLIVGCSSPPPPPPDRRPLGDIMAEPRECGVISHDVIALATGMSEFYADGTESVEHFAYCMISRSPSVSEPTRMLIERRAPSTSTLQGLEARRISDKGTALPPEIGPGFSAPIKGKDGESVGAYAIAWTPDGGKTLTVSIARGAPGRDHQADAVELVRQLRPVLLSSPRN